MLKAPRALVQPDRQIATQGVMTNQIAPTAKLCQNDNRLTIDLLIEVSVPNLRQEFIVQ